MGILNLLRGRQPAAGPSSADLMFLAHAMAGESVQVMGLNDPALAEWVRAGGMTASGAVVNPLTALQNTTVLRCVSLISFSIGMLPLHLQRKDDKTKADDHPLFKILHRKPNGWQTAFEFRSLMQQRALTHGDAFALIVRTGRRVVQLIPLSNDRVQVEQNDDWSLTYRVRSDGRGMREVAQGDVFHLRYGISSNGYTGLSLVKQAAEAIGLAQQVERATSRTFQKGVMAGLALEHPNQLSPEAYARLLASLTEREGADNAGKSFILEEGMKLSAAPTTAKDAQTVEQRKQQIEEIARPFGVPRPLLGVDDTSWGSGIDVLGQMFVQYGLNPWFEAWQQAIERDLLSDAEADIYQAKFNPGGLLRGSMAAQADFWAKALGAGGQQAFALPEEARQSFDWPDVDPARLAPPLGATTGVANDPAQTS